MSCIYSAECGVITVLYIVINVHPCRRCFSLFMTPKVLEILFDILSMCEVQFKVF